MPILLPYAKPLFLSDKMHSISAQRLSLNVSQSFVYELFVEALSTTIIVFAP